MGVTPQSTQASQPVVRMQLPGPRLVVALVAVLLVLHVIDTRAHSLPDSVLACVPCHNTGESDQVGEWFSSPYSAQPGGLECADCHRPPCSGEEGIEKASRETVATSIEHLRKAARLTVTAVRDGDVVRAEVVVANVGAGHLLPTGSVDRILVLEVTASDQAGGTLPLRSGPELPRFAGGSAGTAGRIYLEDPQGRNLDAVRPRLAPFATDVSRYRFGSPESGPALVSARLVLITPTGELVEIANTAALNRPSEGDP